VRDSPPSVHLFLPLSCRPKSFEYYLASSPHFLYALKPSHRQFKNLCETGKSLPETPVNRRMHAPTPTPWRPSRQCPPRTGCPLYFLIPPLAVTRFSSSPDPASDLRLGPNREESLMAGESLFPRPTGTSAIPDRTPVPFDVSALSSGLPPFSCAHLDSSTRAREFEQGPVILLERFWIAAPCRRGQASFPEGSLRSLRRFLPGSPPPPCFPSFNAPFTMIVTFPQTSAQKDLLLKDPSLQPFHPLYFPFHAPFRVTSSSGSCRFLLKDPPPCDQFETII